MQVFPAPRFTPRVLGAFPVALDLPRAAVAACFGLAVLVRGYHVLRAPFPLNDGGLFYAMAGDIQRNQFVLPATTSYNGGEIPFAYSPLALYAAAAFDAVTPASLMDAFRVLPLIGSVLAVLAFWRLASLLIPTRGGAVLATAAFALAPRAFVWLVMGGGLPRSFGLAFALLALAEVVRADREGGRRSTLLAGVWLGLTALTHLETAVFAGISIGLYGAFAPRRRAIPALGAAWLGAMIATPWILAVVAMHGLDPFVNASEQSGQALTGGGSPLSWLGDVLRGPVYTSEPYYRVIGALGVLGWVLAVAERRLFVPAWFALIAVLEMRAGYTFLMAPTCLLAGPLAWELWTLLRARTRGLEWSRAAWAAAVGGLAGVYLLAGALQHSENEGRFLDSFSERDRAAMEWARVALPDDARVAVVPVGDWYRDYAGEWFPALTGRESVATPQGYEWSGPVFEERNRRHRALEACLAEGAGCFERVAREQGATHLYVPDSRYPGLAEELGESPEWAVVYDGGAVILALRG